MNFTIHTRRFGHSRRGKIAVLGMLAIAAAAATPISGGEKVALTVSSCMADGSAEPQYPYQRPTLAATFAERISARERFAARDVRADSWQRAPQGVEPGTHVSLVHVHLGAHHDFLAFLHGGPHHGIRFVARAEAIDRSDVQYWFSVPTGRSQVDRNAPIDLIGHFANHYPGNPTTGDGPVVTMRLEGRPRENDGPNRGAASDVELSSLLPLLTGAACAAGMRPTFEPLPDTLVVKVAVTPGANQCDIEATLAWKQEKRVRMFRRVMFADVFDAAHLLFRSLLHWQGTVLDIAHVSETSVQPLALAAVKGEPLVILEEAQALCARHPISGEAAWKVGPAKTDRADWLFARRLGEDGRLRLYAGRGEISQAVDPATGKTTALPGRSKDAWSIAESGTGLAIADADAVRFFAKGKAQWERKTPCPATAGPAMDPKNVFYGDGEGAVIALSAGDGSEVWRAQLPAPLGPPLTAVSGKVLCATQGGAMFALNAVDGKPVWQFPIGDVSRQVPQSVDGRLLVVSAAGRLLVLDHHTGALVAERDWPTWILSAQVAGDGGGRRVVCLDAGRRISMLSWPSLQAQQEIAIPHRLAPGILECPALPLPWGSRDEFAKPQHVVLVGDERGYLYALRLED